MSLRLASCLLLLGALGCGPESIDPNAPPPDWMLGEFSQPGVEGVQTTAVERVLLTEDGLAHFYTLSGSGTGSMCTDPYVSTETTVPWELDGDEVIIWREGMGDVGYSRLRYVDCNTVSLAYVSSTGNESPAYELFRGQLCLQFNGETCPEGGECEFCETVWCDGSPPPACE